MLKRIGYPFLALLMISVQSMGQTFQNLECEVILEGDQLINPFTGGINAPQFNTLDINLDGLDDLLIFDRVGNVAIPYLHNGDLSSPGFIHAPEYKYLFDHLNNWVLTRDYNNDGIMDLFSAPEGSGLPAIEVRKGKIDNGVLGFELVKFDVDDYNILYFKLGDKYFNIYVSNIDKPEIIDVDNDGDLDVLAFESGGSTAFWYKNEVIEQGLGLDTFSFVLGDMCWGKFEESSLGEQISLSDNASDCFGNVNDPAIDLRHSGSTLTCIDEDDDGDYEVIIGDLTSERMVRLFNAGDENNAWMNAGDVTYPSYDSPVDLAFFNAAYYQDVTFDDKRDLIVAPNAVNNINNYNNTLIYRNINTDNLPVFELSSTDLFASEMIDFGDICNPVFVDYNVDGLIDIVAGSNGKYTGTASKQSALYLLENTGTATQPRFELVDEDFADMKTPAAQTSNLAPAFGDLDNDGDQDMVVGDQAGKLFYLENLAGPGNEMIFGTPVYEYMSIFIGQNAKPNIFDLNEDGLYDLIIGERNVNTFQDTILGNVNFFKNIGQSDNAVFDMNSDNGNHLPTLGRINTRDVGSSVGSSAPYIFDTGSDFLLFTGSDKGLVKVYRDIKGNVEGVFTRTDSIFGNIREGRRTAPAVADINDDGILEIMVGNDRGGLRIFVTNLSMDGSNGIDPISTINSLTLYPNPTHQYLHISSLERKQISYLIHDVSGRLIARDQISSEGRIDVSTLNAGIYFIKMENGLAGRFIKI